MCCKQLMKWSKKLNGARRPYLAFSAVFLVVFYLLHSSRYASTSYYYIPKDDIPKELVTSYNHSGFTKARLCSTNFDTADTRVKVQQKVDNLTLKQLPHLLRLAPGGWWKPGHCVAQHDVAIIIPYRNRSHQLDVFLNHMHPFLKSQLLNYRIVVVEQTFTKHFNRGKLFNVGFIETLKILPYTCFVFHDVDLLPQRLNNIYACTQQPRHMSSSVDTFRYNLLYDELCGGAVAMLTYQFKLINGFSNEFWGWGGEDDDLNNRLKKSNLVITRFDPKVAMYTMLSHPKERPSKDRFQKLDTGHQRYEVDGLSNLNYKIIKRDFLPLYTHLYVDL